MDAEKKDVPQTSPDALEQPSESGAADTGALPEAKQADAKPPKQASGLKKFFKRFNVYLLLFLLVLIIAGAVTAVEYLNSKKTPPAPSIASQTLTTDQLKALANSDATVGATGQTLTIQGNTIVSGQELVRGDLNVAGQIKTGNGLDIPQLTVSGTSNLATTQINTLQVAQTTILQGAITAQNNLTVAGTASFSGPVQMGQLTATSIIISGTGVLQVPNHISFTGGPPNRSIVSSTLGGGGTASIHGSDNAGTININTGNNPAPGCFVKITFNRPYQSTPHVVVTPINAGTGALQWYVTRTATGFSVCTLNAAPAGQEMAFDYFITQ